MNITQLTYNSNYQSYTNLVIDMGITIQPQNSIIPIIQRHTSFLN